jgi:hypothetical protein
MRLPSLVATILLTGALPAPAQTLSSRPAIFADPLLTSDPSRGELVLGHTTLVSALRIFAVELSDSVRVPRAHSSNPDTVPSSFSVGPRSMPAPFHRLDIGPGRYTLYFDQRERLVAAVAPRSRLPRTLRRDELVARYATLKVLWTGYSSEGRKTVEWVIAELAPCVSATAAIWYGFEGMPTRDRPAGTVEEFSYVYTCPTTPAPVRAAIRPPG